MKSQGPVPEHRWGPKEVFPARRRKNQPTLRAGHWQAQTAQAVWGGAGMDRSHGRATFFATWAGLAPNCWALRDSFRRLL